ncbi:endocuticle structural glycoprotein SgAbd-2 [Cephus cinctus]|uniref:Endocuticle structural glycoprotein SgAbd-2 n=1 Tax=Cephus cinctus TaxID=211228 RepID=A0AAJ7BW22_CEPCN|nr:endocuticle structural glycoprotein SgAbd-2 [Cephus cinctus]
MNPIFLAIFATLAVSCYAAPVEQAPIAILSQEQDIGTDGTFSLKFETENGISEQIQGSLKQLDQDTQAQVIQGTASWTAPDGTPVQISWTADENGYQPESSILPTPPPIPAAIQRSLEFIATHPQSTELPKAAPASQEI